MHHLESANINADLAYENAEAALEKVTADALQGKATTEALEEAQNKLDSTQASGDSFSHPG